MEKNISQVQARTIKIEKSSFVAFFKSERKKSLFWRQKEKLQTETLAGDTYGSAWYPEGSYKTPQKRGLVTAKKGSGGLIGMDFLILQLKELEILSKI